MSSDAPQTPAPQPLTLSRAADADWPELITLDARSFALPAPLPDAEIAEFRAKVDEALVVHDTASDGSPLVAVSLWHTLPLTVPGGAIAGAAGLSWVSVAATHRRRGLLRRMLTEQFASWHAAGLPLAILTASEGGIYERFGFGPACFAQSVTIDPAAVTWRVAADGDSRVRYGTPAQIAERVPALHARWAATRPGAIGRPDSWWPSILADRGFRRNSQTSGLHYLLHADGYASYRLDAREMSASIEDFCAVTQQAHDDLWRVITGLDLVRSVRADLPTDDVLPLSLHNARAVTVTGRRDALWVSILDVVAALELRTYDSDGDVVLDIADDWDGRGGRYLLSVREGRATVSRDPDAGTAPTVTLGIAELSSMYTGGIGARELALAGRIVGNDDGAVERLHALLDSAVAPFSGTYF